MASAEAVALGNPSAAGGVARSVTGLAASSEMVVVPSAPVMGELLGERYIDPVGPPLQSSTGFRP